MEIENETEEELHHRNSQLYKDQYGKPPWHIKPNAIGQFYVCKSTSSFNGIFAIATWSIGKSDELLVVMFMVDSYPNILALGIEDKSFKIRSSAAGAIRSKITANFQRKEFYDDITPVQCESEKFYVEGTMGTDSHPAMKILIRHL